MKSKQRGHERRRGSPCAIALPHHGQGCRVGGWPVSSFPFTIIVRSLPISSMSRPSQLDVTACAPPLTLGQRAGCFVMTRAGEFHLRFKP